jgi:CheY-like chemotaxis protein
LNWSCCRFWSGNDIQEIEGSCFSITLPTGKSLPSPKKHDSAVWPKLPGHKNQEKQFKILYVEDNPANMELVVAILFRHNIKLLQAPDASLGIELARAHKPDLILMDINLPGIDGYEALNIIKTDPRTNSIPVIALSADSMASDIKKGLSSGFAEYISKPIHITPFLTTVNKYLV